MALGKLLEMYIERLKKSPVKAFIMSSLLKKEGVSISELQEDLAKTQDPYNYRTIWQHVYSMESSGAILLKKSEHEPGKPVRVFIDPEIKKMKKDLERELNTENKG